MCGGGGMCERHTIQTPIDSCVVSVVLTLLTLSVYWSKSSDMDPGVGLIEATVSIAFSTFSLLALALYLLRLNRFFEAQERKRLTKDQADNYE